MLRQVKIARDPRMEHHAGIDAAPAGEHHLVGLDLEHGVRPVQPRQLALHVGQADAVLAVVVFSRRNQLRPFRLAAVQALCAPDRDEYILVHSYLPLYLCITR